MSASDITYTKNNNHGSDILLSGPQNLVKRPDHGQSGEHIKVITNFIKLTYNKETLIYHYNLAVDPEPFIKSKEKAKALYNLLISTDIINKNKCVYDYAHSIFTSSKLNFEEKTFEFQSDISSSSTNPKNSAQCLKITIKLVGTAYLNDLDDFVKGKITSYKNKSYLQTLMALNVILNQEPSKKMLQFGSSFYTTNPQQTHQISGGLEIKQGYFQSCRPGQDNLLVNIDVKYGTFYRAIGLVQSVCENLGISKEQLNTYRFRDFDFKKTNDHILGLNIFVTHMGKGKTRKYRIMGLSKKTPLEYKFNLNLSQDNSDNNESETNVQEYFLRTYNYKIQYTNLPCIIVNKGNCLPMEVCKLAPDQRYLRKLNERQTSEMIKESSQPPNERLNKILKGIEVLNFNNNITKSFEISAEEKLLEINARIIKPPRINYNPKTRVSIRDASWNLNGVKLMKGGSIRSWMVAYFENPRDERIKNTIYSFARDLTKSCKNLDINIEKEPLVLSFNPIGDLQKHFFDNTIRIRPQLIVCVLPNKGSSSLYSELKRIGDTILGVPTQCVIGNNIRFDPKLQKRRQQYLSNVGLKINSKIGGSNMQVAAEDIKILSDMPTLLVGADVTHPGARDRETCSIAAVVGSTDKYATRYSSVITPQSSRMEIIGNIQDTMVTLVNRFNKNTSEMPKRVIFFRDGVSEGQYEEVYIKEIMNILESFEKIKKGYKPKLTFIVATKRHHVKFFPQDVFNKNSTRHKIRSGNCMPGTVVEDVITHPTDFDFYLQSHAGIKGTSRSCHYTILYDENKFKSDQIQEFTYNLCYTFSRCTSAVSLVTPVYYAHLCAARARHHIKDKKSANYDYKQTTKTFSEVHRNIEEKMYFV